MKAVKRKAVLSALKHPKGAAMSDRQIAEHCGVSQPFVGQLRKDIAVTDNDYKSPTRTGRDGRTTNTANIGKGRRPPTRDSKGHLCRTYQNTS